MSGSKTPDRLNEDLVDAITSTLPQLRRYARALTGNQTSGDSHAAATLEAILANRALFDTSIDPRVALFRAFHLIWSRTGATIAEDDADTLARRAQMHLAGLSKDSREALLLHTIESFDLHQVALVMQINADQAGQLVQTAMVEMEKSARGAVLVIEDEAFIAMDIENIVTAMGHRVTGIARTRAEALILGAKDRPDLILADIRLADNSSGIDAVRDLLALLGPTPAVFITAFPDQLLTGTRPEPTFLISKPYAEKQVRSAVSQAMFFASTETLDWQSISSGHRLARHS